MFWIIFLVFQKSLVKVNINFIFNFVTLSQFLQLMGLASDLLYYFLFFPLSLSPSPSFQTLRFFPLSLSFSESLLRSFRRNQQNGKFSAIRLLPEVLLRRFREPSGSLLDQLCRCAANDEHLETSAGQS